MGLFNNLKSEGLEQSQDRLGGFQVVESGVYEGATIKLAYAGKATSSNAQNVTISFELPGGKEYSETFWITNKNGENFFRNKQDNTKKIPLPGFTLVDDICLMTTEKPLSDQDTEEKMVQMWDAEEKKQMPKAAHVLVDLLGKQVSLGIVKQVVNKNEKQGDEYVPTAETREENVTDKVFHFPSGFTVVEARNQAAEPAFIKAWADKNNGVTRDRRTIKDGQQGASGKSGKPGGPPQAGSSAKPTTSLFGGKS